MRRLGQGGGAAKGRVLPGVCRPVRTKCNCSKIRGLVHCAEMSGSALSAQRHAYRSGRKTPSPQQAAVGKQQAGQLSRVVRRQAASGCSQLALRCLRNGDRWQRGTGRMIKLAAAARRPAEPHHRECTCPVAAAPAAPCCSLRFRLQARSPSTPAATGHRSTQQQCRQWRRPTARWPAAAATAAAAMARWCSAAGAAARPGGAGGSSGARIRRGSAQGAMHSNACKR